MKVVVTGSSTGIGRALTERLLARGHQVWGIARSDQAEFSTQQGGKFRGSRADVSQWDEIERVAKDVAAIWGELHAVITCAGIQGEIGPALSADPVRWIETVHANLDGTYFAVRAFAPLLARTPGRAKVVCFSGGGATKARANFSAYGTAKTGVVRLVETIAEEEAVSRLDINAVAPGAINTRMTDEVIALGPVRAGEAEYAAALRHKENGGDSLVQLTGLVDWLLSPASDGISGKLISAQWDGWRNLTEHRDELRGDIFTLRRIVPSDRGKTWT